MRLREGRIGGQEAHNTVGKTITMGVIFSLNSERTYRDGNLTYLTIPLSILVALMLFLLVAHTMRKLEKKEFFEMLDSAVGKVYSTGVAIVIMILSVISVMMMLSRFIAMVHNFVFNDSPYQTIIPWVMLPVAYISCKGLETIGRMGKFFGMMFLIICLASIIVSATGFRLHRLFPMPISDVGGIAMASLKGSAPPSSALLLMFVITGGLQGRGTAKRIGTGSAIGAMVASLVIQLALGLSYNYNELAYMFAPLYRLNMTLLMESYYSRQDQLWLFLWLLTCMAAAAYYIYMSGLVYCRRLGVNDIRPPVLLICMLVSCVILMGHIGYYEEVQTVYLLFSDYAYLVILAPVGLACIIGLIRHRVRQRRGRVMYEAG